MSEYDYQGFSELGQGISDAINSIHQQRQKHRDLMEYVRVGSVMPMDPTAAPGTPGAKPMFDKKTSEHLMNELTSKGRENDAAVSAYIKMGQQAAVQGAKSRLIQDRLDAPPRIVHTPEGSLFQGSKGWQQFKSGPTAGQAGVDARFRQKETDKNIKQIETELSGADITDPAFLLDSERHKGGHLDSKGEFQASTDKKTHIQVETDDGTVNMPLKKFNHLKSKAQEWKKLKDQKTQPVAGGSGDLPVLTPEQARRAPPNTVFRTQDGRVKKVPAQFPTQPDESNGADSSDDTGSDE